MFGCCRNSGSQYLNEDGTINNPALDKAKYEHRRWSLANTKKTEGEINDEVAAIGTSGCTCGCHTIGSSVFC